MSAPIYRHVQIGWTTLVAVLVIALPIAFVLLAAQRGGALVVLLIPVVILALVLATFAFMTVTVDDAAVTVRMGTGLITRRFALAGVRQAQTVRNPWYYGWGLRLYPGGTLYNVSGLSAIELAFEEGRRVRIGTDDVDGLMTAIDEALNHR